MLRIGLIEESFFPIHEHILAVIWPAPRSIDLDSSPGILHYDGGIVINLGINLRLVAFQYRIDLDRLLAVQQPGRQVGAIAAEIHHGASTVKDRIRQPVGKLLAATYFERALVSVIDFDTVDRSYLACFGFLFDETVGSVPGGFVIGQQKDSMLLCKGSHLPAILK